MKIVVLDGYTLNPGDLDWTPLKKIGELKVFDRTPQQHIYSRSAEASILLTNKTPLTSELINRLERLNYIGVLATGYDVVDIEAAHKLRIPVTNVPGYGADSVAQMVFAHILAITNNVAGHSVDVQSGGWSSQQDFCYSLSPQIELSGKTLGIIGYGEIGRVVARLGLAYGMKILVHTRTEPTTTVNDITFTDLNSLFSSADIISLHCPLTAHTHNMINRDSLTLMKKSAIVINCSRGPLVNEDDLYWALKNNVIASAGLDVLAAEPPPENTRLYTLDNCNITPHIAWATHEARTRLLNIAVSNVHQYLAGKPINVVNG